MINLTDITEDHSTICSCGKKFAVIDGVYADIFISDNYPENTNVYCSVKCLTRFGFKELEIDIDVVLKDIKTKTVKERLLELEEIKNKKDIHVMLDLETLGKADDSSIFQIGALSFELETGNVLETFKMSGDIEKYENLVVDGSTIKWWLKTDKNLLADILLSGTETEEGLFSQLYYWLVKQSQENNMSDVFIWGNGNMFDNVKVKYQMNRLLDTGYPIYYRNDLDVRSVVYYAKRKVGISEEELKALVPVVGTKHDALDDCVFQANLMHLCEKILIHNWIPNNEA